MVCRHPLNFHPFDLIKTFELEGQCPEWFCGLLIFLRISFTDIIIYDHFIMLRFFSSNIHYASRNTGTIDSEIKPSTLIYIPSTSHTDWETSYRSRDIIVPIFEIQIGRASCRERV